MLTFGPVPSRRLGRSLGINNIPPKSCSYSCVYCQVGPTAHTELARRAFYPPQQIADTVAQHLQQLASRDELVDYLTFVPDGEPTLDIHLAETIGLLKPLGIPIAVISNASLIWREEVRETLAQADWVSLKVDAIDDALWRQVNQPDAALDHQAILDGIGLFAKHYKGILATETMLVRGLNDTDEAAAAMATYLGDLATDMRHYLSVPIRPPAEPQVQVPDEATLTRYYQIVSQQVAHLEITAGYEGDTFGYTGDSAADLLGITAVHPMREQAVRELLARNGDDWSVVEQLLETGKLRQTDYDGKRFYIRRMPSHPNREETHGHDDT